MQNEVGAQVEWSLEVGRRERVVTHHEHVLVRVRNLAHRCDVDHLQLDITPEDPQVYLQTMFELIYLAFLSDSTRVATFQLGRENGEGPHDLLSMAVGLGKVS